MRRERKSKKDFNKSNGEDYDYVTDIADSSFFINGINGQTK